MSAEREAIRTALRRAENAGDVDLEAALRAAIDAPAEAVVFHHRDPELYFRAWNAGFDEGWAQAGEQPRAGFLGWLRHRVARAICGHAHTDTRPRLTQ